MVVVNPECSDWEGGQEDNEGGGSSGQSGGMSVKMAQSHLNTTPTPVNHNNKLGKGGGEENTMSSKGGDRLKDANLAAPLAYSIYQRQGE